MATGLDMLMKHPLFSPCDRAALSNILQCHGARVQAFSDDELIHSPSSSSRVIGMLLSGKACVTTPDPSHSALLRLLKTGEMFGIANLFSHEPYISVIRAKGGCRVFLIPESAIKELLECDRDFLARYLAFLSQKICFLNRKIGYLTGGSAERRLALYLTSLDKTCFRLEISIGDLSELLDVGRASLYRAFERLSEDGFIEKNGREFKILDLDGMRNAYR